MFFGIEMTRAERAITKAIMWLQKRAWRK